MLLTFPATAQDTPGEQETERDRPVRIGVYFSRPGLIDNIDLSGLYGGGNIESSEDDVMPYPGSFLSIKYNKYQATLGWGDDNYGKENKHNENIARFTARYNYYPAEKIIYMFGGFNIWYFNKKFSFTKNVCVGDLILEAEHFFCEEENEGKGREAELSFHFYPVSFFYSALSDYLSFPFLDANFRYNAYEGGIGYLNADHAGSTLRLKSRYNLALAKQSIGKQSNSHIREYLYGGINLWHFNKKEIQYERPASKSTILGISMGAGIGFYLGTGLGLSIEPEYNYIPCSEDEEFFCGRWFDVKVGLEKLFLLK